MTNFSEGVEYFIFCGCTDLDGTELANIEINTWTRFNETTRVWYAGKENKSDSLVKQVDAVKPGVLFIIGLYDWHYNIVPILFAKAPRKILSVRGMLHPGALGQKPLKKKVFLNLLKLYGIQKKLVFHATDVTEATYIRQHFGEQAKIHTVGNFPRKMDFASNKKKKEAVLYLVSVALVSPMKNHALVLESLKACTATVHYTICGPIKDTAYWNQCLAIIDQLPSNVQVNYVGDADPSSIHTLLEQADVFILPSKSENFGHAIYEALSSGRPVITSNYTPWYDLRAHHAGLNVDTNIDAVGKAIQFFASMDELELEGWCYGARKYAEEKINFTMTRNDYKTMFETDNNAGDL